jgi:hypothetical protein
MNNKATGEKKETMKKKMLVGLFAAVGLVMVACAWDFVNISIDGVVIHNASLTGTTKIDGTNMTASAAQLNAAAGLTTAVPASTLTGNIALARMTNALTGTVPITTLTLGGKAITLTTLTNVVYNGTTGNVSVVTFTP